MKFIDNLTNASFKTDKSGNTVFYPWGMLWPGYIIASQEIEQKIRKVIGTLYGVSILLVVFSIFILDRNSSFWVFAIAVPILCILYFFSIKKLTAGKPKSDEKMKFSERLRNITSAFNLAFLIILLIGMVFFTAGGAIVFFIADDPNVGLAGIGLFGAGSIFSGVLVFLKIQNRTTE
jgi:hypothetical protein